MEPRRQNPDGSWTKTFHEQGLDLLKEKYGGNLEGLGGKAFNLDNIEGNPNHGNNGQIKDDTRQEFIDRVLYCTER